MNFYENVNVFKLDVEPVFNVGDKVKFNSEILVDQWEDIDLGRVYEVVEYIQPSNVSPKQVIGILDNKGNVAYILEDHYPVMELV